MASGFGIRPEDMRAFVARISSGNATGTPAEMWRKYLQSVTSKTSGTTRELEIAFLVAKGATGKTYGDLWQSYLAAKGYSGSINDKIRKWARSEATP